MDPATAITAIRVTTALAGLLLRGVSSFFGKTPLDPYKYYQLGSYCERWRWACKIGISEEHREAFWNHGIQLFASEAHSSEAQRTRRKISYLAPRILAGEAVSWLKNLHHPALQRREGKWWDWIELGRAEYRDRWVPKAREILGEDPEIFFAKHGTSLKDQWVAFQAWQQVRTTENHDAFYAALAVYNALSEKYDKNRSAILNAWRNTPVSIYLNSGTVAKNELNRWTASREHAKESAVFDALWFGPPVPWALELAATAYGQHGPAAVLQYTSVSRGVTRDLKILLARISPAAMSDPMLAPYLR